MARRPRNDIPGSWHHVVNRAIAKRPYFESRSDKRYFLSRLAAEVRAGRIEVHGFCLMTTHFHLLVRSPTGELSEAMRRAQYTYSRYFNRRHLRDGPLIRARFFSKRIDTDLYWRAVVRYIDDNAVRAGVARTIGEHEFGSARTFLGGRCPPWLSRESVESRALACTGAARYSAKAYLAAFGPRSGEDLESIRELIEERMRSARELDPLEDLVGSTPRQVHAWMKRKAKLADGMEIGLPICGASGLRKAIDLELASHGEWLLDRDGRTRRGSELAWIGLARSLCALSLTKIASLSGASCWCVRRDIVLSAAALSKDEEHAKRVARVARAALSATHPLKC